MTSAIFVKGIRGTNDIMHEGKPHIAFVGRSNVGKSSLMNCLLNRKDLVKSGKTPGKTREINFFLVNDSFYFVDLPGYGYARMHQDEREQLAKMIQWYFHEPVARRKTVVVLDIKAGPSVMDLEMLRILREAREYVLVVANKADTLNQKERHEALKAIAEKIPNTLIIPCSAQTKEARESILQKLLS